MLAWKQCVQWACAHHQRRHFLLVRTLDPGPVDGLHGGVRLGVEREAANGDRQLPKISGAVGGVCGIVRDLFVRSYERVLGAPGGVGRRLDSSRPGTRIHLDHVLRWRIGKSLNCPEQEGAFRWANFLIDSAACSSSPNAYDVSSTQPF